MAGEAGGGADRPFWVAKTLDEMSAAEWESLCDGCGRCCLNKLEDEETGAIAWTDVACRLLDGQSCRCRDYPNRQAIVPDCIGLDAATVRSLSWLPPTCAYRRLDEGKGLPDWHPLLTGDPDSVHAAGISVRGRTVSEADWSADELPERIVRWPGQAPRRRPARGDFGRRKSLPGES